MGSRRFLARLLAFDRLKYTDVGLLREFKTIVERSNQIPDPFGSTFALRDVPSETANALKAIRDITGTFSQTTAGSLLSWTHQLRELGLDSEELAQLETNLETGLWPKRDSESEAA